MNDTPLSPPNKPPVDELPPADAPVTTAPVDESPPPADEPPVDESPPADAPATTAPADESPQATAEVEPAIEADTPLPAAARLALDLNLGPGFRGRSFAEAKWNWPAAVRAAIQLIDHLAAADDHATPLLPGRVLLDADGRLSVQPSTVAEAGPFAAPEVVLGEALDERTAIYHVASLTYALLIGYPPVGDTSRMDRLAPEIPARLNETLLRALAIDMGQRTATLAALREQLLFVLVPPLWYEEVVPRLPLGDEQRTQLTAKLDQAQAGWLRLRDRVPWQRLGRTRKRAGEVAGRPRVLRLLTAGGVLLVLLTYLILLTDLL